MRITKLPFYSPFKYKKNEVFVARQGNGGGVGTI
jgi:hypothetical protein